MENEKETLRTENIVLQKKLTKNHHVYETNIYNVAQQRDHFMKTANHLQYELDVLNNKKVQMKQIGNKLVNQLNRLEDKNNEMKGIVDNAAVKVRAAAVKYSTLKTEKVKADKRIVELEKQLDKTKAKKFSCIIM